MSYSFFLFRKSREKSGQHLAGGYFCSLIALIGDLDYFSKWLGTPVSTNHSKPCVQCRTQFTGPLSWQDNTKNSPWQHALLHASTWRNHWTTPCSLLRLPGCNAWTIALDLMHNFWLGWLQFAYGSIFYHLCFDILPGEPLANLRTVQKYIKNFQRKGHEHHRYRQRLEKLSMFTREKGYPKLKGKAADIKGLCYALLSCWRTYMRPDSEQDQQVAAFLTLNLEVHDLLDAYSPKFGFMCVPAPHCDALYEKGLQMAQLHGCLSDHFASVEMQLWNLTSKTHFCMHTFYLSRYIHPSLTWAFKGENMMKAVQTVWRSCLSGNKHHGASKVAAIKLRHLLHIQDDSA